MVVLMLRTSNVKVPLNLPRHSLGLPSPALYKSGVAAYGPGWPSSAGSSIGSATEDIRFLFLLILSCLSLVFSRPRFHVSISSFAYSPGLSTPCPILTSRGQLDNPVSPCCTVQHLKQPPLPSKPDRFFTMTSCPNRKPHAWCFHARAALHCRLMRRTRTRLRAG